MRFATLAVAAALVAGACSSGKPNLTKLVLTGTEASRAGGLPVSVGVGPGSRQLAGASGVTLDQCAPSYASETERAARYQVAYVDVTGRIIASNEIVRYKAGGAAQSYRELRDAVAHCAIQGGATEFELGPRDNGLLPQQVAFSVRVAQAGAAVYEDAVYQYRGDLLDVVYAFRGTRADAVSAASNMAKLARTKLSS